MRLKNIYASLAAYKIWNSGGRKRKVKAIVYFCGTKSNPDFQTPNPKFTFFREHFRNFQSACKPK